jgi:aminoglycoside phosphotransferase (APT) family kinase protein
MAAAGIPQHGDLNPEHVFIGADGRLTTIDWEDAGLGYPAMFDFFCFVSGMGFVPAAERYGTDTKFQLRSFLATYCEENWFSLAVAAAARRVAAAFGLAPEEIPAAFEAYLTAREHQFCEPRFGKAASGAELPRLFRAEFEQRRCRSVLAAGRH